MSSPILTPQPGLYTIRQRLKDQGKTLKSWAAENGFSYRVVREVARGNYRGYFGQSRKVRIALGLPVVD